LKEKSRERVFKRASALELFNPGIFFSDELTPCQSFGFFQFKWTLRTPCLVASFIRGEGPSDRPNERPERCFRATPCCRHTRLSGFAVNEP
jgi:hypothetical protein